MSAPPVFSYDFLSPCAYVTAHGIWAVLPQARWRPELFGRNDRLEETASAANSS